MEYKWSDRVAHLEGNAIREIFKLLANPEVISFAGGLPAKEGIPTEILRGISQELLCGDLGYKILQYGATEGWQPLFESGAAYLEDSGIYGANPTNMLLISGGQQGIDLTFKTFINKGDAILFENPTYLAALHIAKTYEAKLIGVDADDDGLSLTDLEEKIKRHNPKILYLVPNFSNPTGRTLSAEKRQAIAEMTAKYGVIVLEDDPYGKIRFEGEDVPSIKSFDKTGNVLYNTSFSKTVSPGLRVGIITGDSAIIRKLTIGKQATDVHTATLNQALVDVYLRRGLLYKTVNAVKPIYKEKKDAMIAAMERYFPKEIKFTRPEGGLFIWCEGAKTLDMASELMNVVKEKKVAYVAGDAFFADGSGKNTFRLNYSNASFEQIEKGIKSLGDYIKGLK